MTGRRKTSRITLALASVVGAVLSVAIYLLLAGPAYWMMCSDWISSETYALYATPAWHLVKETRTQSFWDKYVEWWEPELPDLDELIARQIPPVTVED